MGDGGGHECLLIIRISVGFPFFDILSYGIMYSIRTLISYPVVVLFWFAGVQDPKAPCTHIVYT